MAIKNILLHLTEDPRNDARIEAAIGLAQRHDSQITAFFVTMPPQVPAYVMAYIPADVIERQVADARAAAEKQKQALLERCRREGVPVEWRQSDGDPRELMAIHARYADLVVVGQPGVGDEAIYGTEQLAEELVLTAGRPLLCIPYAGRFAKIGDRVLLAWNATREATRAVHDAMPILVKASKVIVYSVNADGRTHIPGADIAAHLARHGVKAEAHHTVARDIDIGDALLSAVADHTVDLLVMGAYGHSRVRELALGGATRSILAQMTVPALLSH